MKDNLITSTLSLLISLLCCCFCQGAEHMRCNHTSDKIGCFKRYPPFVGVKLFDILVMTDRDWASPQYGGQDIDWFNWANYMHGFRCRCHERLKQLVKDNDKKYHHFSISNYGECWTSEDIIYDLTKLGLDNTCVGEDYLSCQDDAESECFGAADSQFVFHVNYEDEPDVDEFELLNSACRVETLTVCSSPSISYASSTVVHP